MHRALFGACRGDLRLSRSDRQRHDSAKLPQSLQRLMDSPVLQVKKSCKKEGYCLKCTKTCDKYKKSDYCQMEKNKSDTSCCKHYENDCKCVSCLPM